MKPLERKNACFRFTTSLNIPGFKRVVGRNAPPLARSRNLLVTAPTSGPEFRVEFPVPVEDQTADQRYESIFGMLEQAQDGHS